MCVYILFMPYFDFGLHFLEIKVLVFINVNTIGAQGGAPGAPPFVSVSVCSVPIVR